MVFIDLEKAYDTVPRQLIWDSLEGRGLPGKYIDIIKDTYDRTETSVRTPVGDTNSFPVDVGLHQGSALSPFLFAVVLDELSNLIQEPVPWCMLFADDIVLSAETKQCLNARVEEWRVALEGKGLRISRSKTEYLHCDFSGVADDDDTQITIEDQLVPQATKFKYLGSFVQRDGDIDSDVTHRIQAGWCRWRAASGVLCDRRFPTKLKGKFYRVAVRPAMLYGTDCWAIKKTQARKMEVAEMRMLSKERGRAIMVTRKHRLLQIVNGSQDLEKTPKKPDKNPFFKLVKMSFEPQPVSETLEDWDFDEPQPVSKTLEDWDFYGTLALPKNEVGVNIVSRLEYHLQSKLLCKEEVLDVVLIPTTDEASSSNHHKVSLYKGNSTFMLTNCQDILKDYHLKASDIVMFQLKEVKGEDLYVYFSFLRNSIGDEHKNSQSDEHSNNSQEHKNS
ncbi:uncharacterized protein LOC110888973 [Helianthus annuus]|uniref:uncharacterized protein LOC110888973 n=1 Tax=Helianthus annuus TaxID=4232 RepID=UPI000B8FA485|nr:uncharacterized protein LOC110888973 [Helianthus annuus]